MLKNKITNFFTKNLFKDKLHTIDGRELVAPNNIEEDLTRAQFKSLEIINNLTKDDFGSLIKNGFLSSSEKTLLFNILSLFNSLEVNFNRVLGLNSNSCALMSAILKDNENPSYKKLFQADFASKSQKILQGYIDVRHLIAHGLAKKHMDTNSIIFITSNKNDWNKKLKKRKENPKEFSNRPDKHILLNEMGEKSIIYAVLNIPLLEYIQSILIPIEKYFAEHAAIETQ